MGEADWLEC
uniref:Uncharacterized protein n=1 Tax=Anguilla anguilla TaxID=7936 RepID=A0A0E9QPX5_ANGAN